MTDTFDGRSISLLSQKKRACSRPGTPHKGDSPSRARSVVEIRAVARLFWFRRSQCHCCSAMAALGVDSEVPTTSDVVWGDRFPS